MSDTRWTSALADKPGLRSRARRIVLRFEDATLLLILLITLIAGGQELWHMAERQSVSLTDLLLMFIYLEVISMVRVYWDLGRLPVTMPLYIAMIALARHLIIGDGGEQPAYTLGEAGAVLILAAAVLVVRFGNTRFPMADDTAEPPAHGGKSDI